MIEDIMNRLCAIEKQASVGLPHADLFVAYPFFLHRRTDYPYTLHRLGNTAYDTQSEEIFIDTRTVITRLVIGKETEGGYVGAPDSILYAWMPAFERAYRSVLGMQLMSDSDYPDAPLYTMPDGVTLVSSTGLLLFKDAPGGGGEVGVDFTLTIKVFDPESEYYGDE